MKITINDAVSQRFSPTLLYEFRRAYPRGMTTRHKNLKSLIEFLEKKKIETQKRRSKEINRVTRYGIKCFFK